MELVFFLEEPSAKALLTEFLPRLLPEGVTFTCIVFEGKQDLEKQLPGKLKGWLRPSCRFVVLRDQDAGDCRLIKKGLRSLCTQAGKGEALIRIACRELEAWYLGDLAAVEKALHAKGAAGRQGNHKFRNPDRLGNPVQELTRLARGYQKISGSRAMGRVMGRMGNASRSFNVFMEGVEGILGREIPA